MYGVAAIQQANGWVMAGAGAGIVLLGLAVLAFLISMLPRLTSLFETKAPPPFQSVGERSTPKLLAPDKLPEDIGAAASIYMTFTASLGDDFSLVDLHRKAKEVDLPQPHLSINRFRDTGRLIALGKERFAWQPKSD